MYSALGMNLFPYVKWGDGLKDGINFTTFWLSFWTLFKCAGGEDWSYILADISNKLFIITIKHIKCSQMIFALISKIMILIKN